MNDYNARLLLAFQKGVIKRGQVVQVEIRHDDWCSILHGRSTCTCNADVVLKTDHGDVRILSDGTAETA
jgi:uncharacterized cupin superfamily protein